MALAAVDCGDDGENPNDELSPSLALGFFPASDMIPATTLEPPIGSLDRVVFESEHARIFFNEMIRDMRYLSSSYESAGVNISVSAKVVTLTISPRKTPMECSLRCGSCRKQKNLQSESGYGKKIEEQMALMTTSIVKLRPSATMYVYVRTSTHVWSVRRTISNFNQKRNP